MSSPPSNGRRLSRKLFNFLRVFWGRSWKNVSWGPNLANWEVHVNASHAAYMCDAKTVRIPKISERVVMSRESFPHTDLSGKQPPRVSTEGRKTCWRRAFLLIGLDFSFFWDFIFYFGMCGLNICHSGFLCLSVPPPSSTRLSTSMRRRAPPSQDFTRHRGQGFLTGTRKDAFLLIVCKMMGLFFLTTSYLNTVALDVWVPYFLWIGIGGTVWYRIF